MLRLRGDRSSLLAALLAHWSEQQLALPASMANISVSRPQTGRPVSGIMRASS
jgi:hypothetical protein